MKKYVIAGVLVIAAVAYYVFAAANHDDQTATSIVPPTTTDISGTGSAPTTTSNSASSTGSTTGQYKDGIYTSAVEDAFYGNLQVKVSIAGGKVTDVSFVQYPQGGHSSDVSTQALPVLVQEEIATQSANVNVVSGATQDSEAFDQAMADVFAQAKA